MTSRKQAVLCVNPYTGNILSQHRTVRQAVLVGEKDHIRYVVLCKAKDCNVQIQGKTHYGYTQVEILLHRDVGELRIAWQYPDQTHENRHVDLDLDYRAFFVDQD